MTGIAFHLPDTIEEAVGLLVADPESRCLAGGATLVAMMNAGLMQPSGLISLRRVAALHGIERSADGWVRIGAMTRHCQTAASGLLEGGHRVVRHAASVIASPPVRNMGTIGGAVAFADPAADYLPALVAADAEIEIVGSNGPRRLVAEAFFLDWYQTALEPGELIVAVHLPPGPPRAVGRYNKLSRVEGDYATASVAVVLEMERGICSRIALAVGACGPKPIRLSESERALVGGRLDEDALAIAGGLLADAADPVDDVRASADYRRLVIPRLVRRAVRSAATEFR
ncbi:MAG TPA: xanthine dehydrogenase family protein subunit M [Alphaproteobacteria bacterium]|nr:xanthine dehydrogenase family protein subunit M [Alphaproteobacteria bacterium]